LKIAYAYRQLGGPRGIERAALELANAVAAREHEVHFYCSTANDSVSPRVRIHRVRVPSLPNALNMYTFGRRVPRCIRDYEPDLTHGHGDIAGCDILTAQSCHKYALARASHLSLTVKRANRNWGIADRIRVQSERKAYCGGRCRMIVAVSEGVRQEIIETYGVPSGIIRVIPNGVNTQEFSPYTQRERGLQVKRSLRLDPDDVVLLFVGNEFDRKGLAATARALALPGLGRVKLVVAGDDDKTPYVQLACDLGVSDRVRFVGKVADIAPLYAAADIFVMPTLYEAHSLAVVEAAASGLPLVVTKVSGMETVVREGFSGYFVQRNPLDIARALVMLANAPDMGHQMGAAARVLAEKLSWERIAEMTIDLYREFLKI
jgi:UDP-glucose:(heptosyl)LPS alpha-1,3-glucosyltransferase